MIYVLDLFMILDETFHVTVLAQTFPLNAELLTQVFMALLLIDQLCWLNEIKILPSKNKIKAINFAPWMNFAKQIHITSKTE